MQPGSTWIGVMLYDWLLSLNGGLFFLLCTVPNVISFSHLACSSVIAGHVFFWFPQPSQSSNLSACSSVDAAAAFECRTVICELCIALLTVIHWQNYCCATIQPYLYWVASLKKASLSTKEKPSHAPRKLRVSPNAFFTSISFLSVCQKSRAWLWDCHQMQKTICTM